MAHRYQHVEHAILTAILKYGNHRGYANTLPGLANILRPALPDITNPEIIDTLKRLEPQFLTLWKYGSAFGRFVPYSQDEIDDEYLFGEGDFCIQRTPQTDPYVQELALELGLSEAGMTSAISEEGRRQRFARWEEMGLDRVKADLVHNRGRGEVGGSHEVLDLAWEWVRMKEAQIAAAAKPQAPAALGLTSDTRLDELRALRSSQFDFKKLVRLCEEINTVYGQECYCATAMLTRAVLDHVPPIFGKANFEDVASQHGGKSFKEAMQHLNNASRSVADGHLHEQIRRREALPTAQQVDCRQQLDVLLAEIVRLAP